MTSALCIGDGLIGCSDPRIRASNPRIYDSDRNLAVSEHITGFSVVVAAGSVAIRVC